MATKNKKFARRLRIKRSIRSKVSGTAARPRLSVFRSNKALYAQLIDDEQGHTLASAFSGEVAGEKKTVDLAIAKQVGQKIAEKAKAKGVEKVTFDRNGYLYHGRVKALAEGAREAGLEF